MINEEPKNCRQGIKRQPAKHEGERAMITRTKTSMRATASMMALAFAIGAAAPAHAAITNEGSVTASTPDGGTVSGTATESVTLEAANPLFTIDKSVASISSDQGADSAFPDGGDVVTFQYLLENTGNVSLTGASVSITDPGPTFIDAGSNVNTAVNTLSSIIGVDGGTPGINAGDTDGDGNVDPGEIWIYEATYTLDQADVDEAAGVLNGIENTITTATANDTGGDPATLDTGNSQLTATGCITENAVVTLAKVATDDGSTPNDGSVTPYGPGDTIVYLFTVANEGNVTLSNITVSETNFVAPSGAGAPAVDCGGGSNVIASLAPGGTASCSASYTVQEGDL